MNYTELQARILAQSVHPELVTEVVDFIRDCESLIRRKVQALELRYTLDEGDRDTDGIYTLPRQIQTVRRIFGEDAPAGLENVGLVGIRRLAATDPVLHYAVSGQTVEFRGVPGEDVEHELVYVGWPDPLETTAFNDLLTNHGDLYLYGGLFYLYQHEQELELAQASLSVFTDAANDINEAAARLKGGGSVLPAYNFGQVRTGRGY